jgi:hypothetical protein
MNEAWIVSLPCADAFSAARYQHSSAGSRSTPFFSLGPLSRGTSTARILRFRMSGSRASRLSRSILRPSSSLLGSWCCCRSISLFRSVRSYGGGRFAPSAAQQPVRSSCSASTAPTLQTVSALPRLSWRASLEASLVSSARSPQTDFIMRHQQKPSPNPQVSFGRVAHQS